MVGGDDRAPAARGWSSSRWPSPPEGAQPGLKCRGREYLRIIYGPEYDAPSQIDRLRSRSLGRKRSMASREFALGVEALERFTRREPLYRVHECVFAVLALEVRTGRSAALTQGLPRRCRAFTGLPRCAP